MEPGRRDNPQGSDQPGGAAPTPARKDHKAGRALRKASWEGNMATVKRSMLGMTPVMTAARRGKRKEVELLKEKVADMSVVNVFGVSAPTPARKDHKAGRALRKASWEGNMATVKRSMLGMTPVMTAARRGKRKEVELLKEKGADMSVVNVFGDNILHCACEGGHVETVKYVLSLEKVDIDARNKAYRTAADLARIEGHKKVVKLLKQTVMKNSIKPRYCLRKKTARHSVSLD